MSYDQLLGLRHRLDQELAGRGDAELQALKEKLLLIAAAQGVTVTDLFKPPKKERQKRDFPVKYRDPEAGEGWTGMGKPKKWLQAKLDAGRQLEEFLVQ